MSRYNPTTKPENSNGILAISAGTGFAWMKIVLIGGPFDNFPHVKVANFGVCVRSERVPETGVSVHIPIDDFSVPDQTNEQISAAVLKIVAAALAGKAVYVGCMGGWGRTGLVMGVVAKAMGIKEPIKFVREKYTSHAIETIEQQDYINNFDVTDLSARIKKLAWEYRVASFLPESLRHLIVSM